MANKLDQKQNEYLNFDFDIDGEVARFVIDNLTHDKLDALIAAVGGSSNTTATISNEAIAAPNVEQSFVLPSNTKRFLIRNRANNDIKFAYTVGGTASDWLTIKKGAVLEDTSFYSAQTIYFQTDNAGDVIEIVTYV